MSDDERRATMPDGAAQDDLAMQVAQLFRHAGEHAEARMLRELVLRYRRERAASGAPSAENGDG